VFGPDYEAALTHVDERVDVRLPGLDLTFSAPKSVSVLYGLAADTVAEQVRLGHEAAVTAALGYLERVAGHALRGHQGDGMAATRISTQGFVAAAFGHRSNRCGDPQLHTHVVVANMLLDECGRVSALDSRELYRQARTAGFLYQAALRAELTGRLGVAWGPVTRGHAEIVGVPEKLRALFSKRRHQIEQALADIGERSPRAAQHATLATRPAKDTSTPARPLRERWADEAHSNGIAPETLSSCLERARPDDVGCPDIADASTTLLNPHGLTHDTSTFDRRDILRGLAELARHGARVEDLEALANGLAANSEVVPLATPGPERRFSTAELLAVEQRGLKLAATHPATVAVDDQTIDAALAARPDLTDGQRTAARDVVSSASGVDVVIGHAGSGKTTMLAVAKSVWDAAAIPVIGAAVAASAAQHLEAATGIRSTSLTRLLADAALIDPDTGRPSGLPPGGVVVLDEAAMVGTRAFVELLEHAAVSNTKVVAVGDPHQLPAIEAGGMFAALAARLGAVELAQNLRQDDVWEHAVLEDLRCGDVVRGVLAYLDHDRVHTADTAPELVRQLVDDWHARWSTDAAVTILASRRTDVAMLNDAARARLLTARALHGPELSVDDPSLGTRRFASGDRVVVTRNTYRRGLLNGTRAEVVDVRPDTGELTIRDQVGYVHDLPADLVADRLTHAYALTCHKAQGLTIDVALLYGTGALTREAGYVGLSRGRRENHIYATTDDLDQTLRTGLAIEETDDLPQHRRDECEHPDVVHSLVAPLETSRAKSLANESFDQPYQAIEM
jgi:conjugative relaxase-like TrwC/TraI family protein